MTLYQYTAKDTQGNYHKGSVEANTPREARELIRKQKLITLSYRPSSSRWAKYRWKEKEKIVFCVQLSHMLQAGMPLYDALSVLEEQTRGQRSHPILLQITEKMKKGASLSETLYDFPYAFDSFFVAMVEAGESTASLDQALQELATYLKKQEHLRKQITSALLYPAIVLTFAAMAITLLLTYAVPMLEHLLKPKHIHGITSLVFLASHAIRTHFLALALIPLSLSSLLYFLTKRPFFLYQWDKILVSLPLLGRCIKASSLARIMRSFATLQQGGVSLLQSLEITTKLLKNRHLAAELIGMRERIIGGQTLISQLTNLSWMPPMAKHMLAITEESGELPHMLNNIARIYEEEVEKQINYLIAFITPIVLIVTGAIVGGIMLAILLPLTNLSNML